VSLSATRHNNNLLQLQRIVERSETEKERKEGRKEERKKGFKVPNKQIIICKNKVDYSMRIKLLL
jgi:hypothetical protein